METAFFKYGHPTESMTGDERTSYAQNYYNSTMYDNTYETGYMADIVFIFLGTNDDLSEGSAERFAEAYVNFVGRILEVYGADTDIWVMQALSSSNNPNNPDSPRFDCMTTAFEALQAAYGDNINVIDFGTAPVEEWGIIDYVNPAPGSDKPDPTHPTSEGHVKLRNEIAALLQAKYTTAE